MKPVALSERVRIKLLAMNMAFHDPNGAAMVLFRDMTPVRAKSGIQRIAGRPGRSSALAVGGDEIEIPGPDQAKGGYEGTGG